jgi:hypothetical protein
LVDVPTCSLYGAKLYVHVFRCMGIKAEYIKHNAIQNEIYKMSYKVYNFVAIPRNKCVKKIKILKKKLGCN